MYAQQIVRVLLGNRLRRRKLRRLVLAHLIRDRWHLGAAIQSRDGKIASDVWSA
jgi:hypothetical protein